MSTSTIFEQEPGRNEKAVKGFAKIVAILIILSVTGMGDVMYITVMQSKFPTGLLLIFCYAGAFSSFLGMIYLLIGKTVMFRPGKQMLASWLLLGVELIIAALNTMLVFQGPNTDGAIGLWAILSPVTPVIVLAGVLIVFFLDPELETKHNNMEMQDSINELERNFKVMQHKTEMNVRVTTLNMTQTFLIEELQKPENIERVRGNAARLLDNMLASVTGVPTHAIAPKAESKTVESTLEPTEAVKLAQTATTSETPKEQNTEPLAVPQEAYVVMPDGTRRAFSEMVEEYSRSSKKKK